MGRKNRAKKRGRGPLKGSRLELTTESLNFDGRGVARAEEGKVVFVSGALPGETVWADCHADFSDYAEAVAAELLSEANPDRVEPFCAIYHDCGGCSLQHLEPAAQLRWKEKILTEQFRHIGRIELEPDQLAPSLASPRDRGYRRKARLGARYDRKRDRVWAGFRQKTSNYVISGPECAILDPAFSHLNQELEELIYRCRHRDRIPQIEVAAGENSAALVVRHLEPWGPGEAEMWIDWARERGLRLYFQPGKMTTVHCVYDPDGETGKLPLLSYRPEADLRLEFAPGDFVQVNDELNKKMIEQALDWLELTGQERILDLFCGLGNFTLPLARRAGRVLGLEGEAALVEKGRHNARLNGFTEDQVVFDQMDLANPEGARLKEMCPSGQIDFDTVLLDPPRSGAREVLAAWRDLVLNQVEKILYVSCNPATLARDAAFLTGPETSQRFELKKVSAMDMFPHTAHVEAMALFIRRKTP